MRHYGSRATAVIGPQNRPYLIYTQSMRPLSPLGWVGVRAGLLAGLVPLLIVLTLIARVSYAGAACTFMNFDTDDLSGSGWSDPSIISTSDGDMHGQFGSSIIDRTYTGLPAHDKIKVNARLWAVGSWDSGETAFVLVDAILVFIKDR